MIPNDGTATSQMTTGSGQPAQGQGLITGHQGKAKSHPLRKAEIKKTDETRS